MEHLILPLAQISRWLGGGSVNLLGCGAQLTLPSAEQLNDPLTQYWLLQAISMVGDPLTARLWDAWLPPLG